MNQFGSRRWVSLLGLAMFLTVQTSHAFRTVVLDAGHGGHDRGAAADGFLEKHMALDTTRRVESILKRMGYRVIMTRKEDYFVTLKDRSKIANRYSHAVFVSIHYNSASNKNADGIETFFYHSHSSLLAQYIQAYLIKNTGAVNRGVKSRSFSVIRETTRMPSVLVECGFISNAKQRSKLRSGSFRAKLAESIVQGIIATDQAQ